MPIRYFDILGSIYSQQASLQPRSAVKREKKSRQEPLSRHFCCGSPLPWQKLGMMRAFSSRGLKQGMVLICRPLQQGSSPPQTVCRRRTASFLNAAAVVHFLPCHQWLWGVAFLTLLMVTHSAWCRKGPMLLSLRLLSLTANGAAETVSCRIGAAVRLCLHPTTTTTTQEAPQDTPCTVG